MSAYYLNRSGQVVRAEEAVIGDLLRLGAITDSTYVWTVASGDWTTFGELGKEEFLAALADPSGGEPPVGDFECCAVSGVFAPRELMLEYGSQWVLPEHKERFVQTLRENVSEVIAPGSWEPPATVWEAYRIMIRLARRHGALALIVWLFVFVPIQFLSCIVSGGSVASFAELAAILLDLTVGSVAFAVLFAASALTYREEPDRVPYAIHCGLAGAWGMVKTRLCAMLFVIFAMILFVIPGIYVAMRILIAPALRFLPGAEEGIAAMHAAWDSCRGRKWENTKFAAGFFLLFAPLMSAFAGTIFLFDGAEESLWIDFAFNVCSDALRVIGAFYVFAVATAFAD